MHIYILICTTFLFFAASFCLVEISLTRAEARNALCQSTECPSDRAHWRQYQIRHWEHGLECCQCLASLYDRWNTDHRYWFSTNRFKHHGALRWISLPSDRSDPLVQRRRGGQNELPSWLLLRRVLSPVFGGTHFGYQESRRTNAKCELIPVVVWMNIRSIRFRSPRLI